MTQFIVYTTSAFRCPYCVRVKRTLESNGYTYVEHDVSNRAVRAELLFRRPSLASHLTVPQIFLSDGTYIGGCDDLHALIDQDRLDTMLEMLIEAEIVEEVAEELAAGVGIIAEGVAEFAETVVDSISDGIGGFVDAVFGDDA